MMQAWVAFAASGSPEGEQIPRWPRHRSDSEPQMLRFDAITGPIAPPEAVLCAIYRERTAASPSQN
jgi:carboxylesterase type B